MGFLGGIIRVSLEFVTDRDNGNEDEVEDDGISWDDEDEVMVIFVFSTPA